jgi:peptidoglycan/xylan/chitin deacetylase (PgdA/CDA1 family)
MNQARSKFLGGILRYGIALLLVTIAESSARAGDYFAVHFDSTNDVSAPPWQNWFGWAFSGLSWDPGSDAGNNPASGSLKITAQFPSAIPPIGACCGPQYVVMNGSDGISPALDGTLVNKFECDVRFDPASANDGSTFGSLDFGSRGGGQNQPTFGSVQFPKNETNWVHVSLPVNATATPDFTNIPNVFVKMFSTTLAGASTVWVDNIRLSGPGVGVSNPPPVERVQAPYQIATWQGFRPAAISYTFDDDLTNQYAIAVPMFNAKGLKLTLFTVVNWVPGGSWAPIQQAAAFGHEIASHTVTHTDLSTLSDADQTNELRNSQIAIKANVPGQKCLTLAYPNCVEAKESITSQYYIASRICSGQLAPATPPNFQAISSYLCGVLGTVRTTMDFNSTADSAAAANSWCVYLIHALDAENGYSPLPSVFLQGAVDYVSTNQNRFWVDTFGNVVRYIKERDAVQVIETSSGPDSLTSQVIDDLDGSIYDFPITLRRPLPAGWLGAVVMQGNQTLRTQLSQVSGTNFVTVDVVPNAGQVTIVRAPLAFSLSNPQGAGPNFNFRLNGQPGAQYLIQGSTNQTDWFPMYNVTLDAASTNLSVLRSNSSQYYRALWTH